MNKWEKLKIASISLSTVVIPVVIALVGHLFSEAITERQMQGKFIELSVKILEQEPYEHTNNLRGWAVNVINKYSEVPIDEATRRDLIQSVPIYSTALNSFKAELTPGSEFIFNDTKFALSSCAHVGNKTTCTLTVTPAGRIERMLLRPAKLSETTVMIKIEGEGQVWSYKHGPPAPAFIELRNNVPNEFQLTFQSRTGSSGGHRADILINLQGEVILVEVHSDV